MNDWYRLDMEVVLTANKFRGIEPGDLHDGIARQIKHSRMSSSAPKRKNRLVHYFRQLFINKKTEDLTFYTAK